MQKALTLTFIMSLLILCQNASYKYQDCPSTSILSTRTFACTTCPDNKFVNPSQAIPTKCICKPGYEESINGTCTKYNKTCDGIFIYNVLDINGTYSSANVDCVSCDSNSYPNVNRTRCIRCASGMEYKVGQGCSCPSNSTTTIKTIKGCFEQSLTSALNLGISTSVYQQQLKYLFPGCYFYNDYLSCSELLNLCSYSLGSSTPECNFWVAANKNSNLLIKQNQTFKLSQGQFGKGSKFNIKLITFSSTGNYIGEKTMVLSNIFRCGLPSDESFSIQVGNNIKIQCTYNFNNLVKQIGGKNYKSYLYQLFIQGSAGKFYEVGVKFPGNTNTYKRFFLEDTITDKTKIKIANNIEFKFVLNSAGQLTSPTISLNYVTLFVDNGAISSLSEKIQKLSFSVIFSYQLSSFWPAIIGIFIAVNVLVLIHGIMRTYIGYLNRKSPLQFFINFMKVWSLWMFYFLMAVSGYWFFFTKTTDKIFIFIPDSSSFYVGFYVLAAIMGIFRVISVAFDKIEKVNTEVFLINWERGSIFKNSWREIFIVNSLAEFYTYRTISMFWLLSTVMFFMIGLKWENHSAETITLTTIYSFNPQNRVLLYFLGSSIFIITGIIFKVLRRLCVLFWPYPFENFVDYCNITNISFFFMKKRIPEAYYIHASIPNRTEVGLKDINETVQRGLEKNRSINRQVPLHGHLRLFTVYVSNNLDNNFNAMLEKTSENEQINNPKRLNAYKRIPKENYREKFVQQKLKPRLEEIIRENTNRTKSLFQSLCGFPPISLRDPAALQKDYSLFDQDADLVSQVFPNGNEFEDIHTFIIIFLLWNLILNNSPAAAFLTYLIDQFVINKWISYQSKKNLQKMTGVRQGFML